MSELRKGRVVRVDAKVCHVDIDGEIVQAAPRGSLFENLGVQRNPIAVGDFVQLSTDGDPVAIDGKEMSPATLLEHLNKVAGEHGIGRSDIVENRYVGMKNRGCYETPGGTVLIAAHRAMESITLDRGAAHLKDEMMPRYAELIYNGFWFSPEREMMQAAIDHSQARVNGTVRLKLYKGNVIVEGRTSPDSLYSMAHVTFEEDSVYDQRDAEGFIKLNALRLRLLNRQKGG